MNRLAVNKCNCKFPGLKVLGLVVFSFTSVPQKTQSLSQSRVIFPRHTRASFSCDLSGTVMRRSKIFHPSFLTQHLELHSHFLSHAEYTLIGDTIR